MAELTEFQRGQIVGARMVGASVTKVAKVLGVSRDTTSKIMTAHNMVLKTEKEKHLRERNAELTEFQRGQIVGARMVGVSVTKVATMFGVSRGTVSKIMTAHSKTGKTASDKHQRGRKCALNETDRLRLREVVTSNRKSTAQKIADKLNTILANPISTKTVRRELHKQGFLLS